MELVYLIVQRTFSFLSTNIVSGVSFLGIILAAVIFLLLVRYF